MHGFEYQQADATLELLEAIQKLELNSDLSEAQNIFYSKIVIKFDKLIEAMNRQSDRELLLILFDIAKRLNLNIVFYKTKFDKAILH